jgi:RNA-binding protein YhbY
MQSNTLNTQKKKSLRGVAHHLDPVVAISERGLSQGIVDETERALRDHELIKVKVLASTAQVAMKLRRNWRKKHRLWCYKKSARLPYSTDTTPRLTRSFLMWPGTSSTRALKLVCTADGVSLHGRWSNARPLPTVLDQFNP